MWLLSPRSPVLCMRLRIGAHDYSNPLDRFFTTEGSLLEDALQREPPRVARSIACGRTSPRRAQWDTRTPTRQTTGGILLGLLKVTSLGRRRILKGLATVEVLLLAMLLLPWGAAKIHFLTRYWRYGPDNFAGYIVEHWPYWARILAVAVLMAIVAGFGIFVERFGRNRSSPNRPTL